jgi:hypothetical protein
MINILKFQPGCGDAYHGPVRPQSRVYLHQPHRSLDGRRIVNYIQWQSRDLLHSAHKSPEFRKEWGQFDQLADEIDPHLYEVAHVMDSGE